MLVEQYHDGWSRQGPNSGGSPRVLRMKVPCYARRCRMDKIVVEGGARLVGKIPISGAKNAALPLLAAALLPSGASTFKNVPRLADVRTMAKLLRMLGWQVDGEATVLTIAPPTGKSKPKLEAPYELVKTMRASVLVLGPLVARYGRGRVSLPGGCA